MDCFMTAQILNKIPWNPLATWRRQAALFGWSCSHAWHNKQLQRIRIRIIIAFKIEEKSLFNYLRGNMLTHFNWHSWRFSYTLIHRDTLVCVHSRNQRYYMKYKLWAVKCSVNAHNKQFLLIFLRYMLVSQCIIVRSLHVSSRLQHQHETQLVF